MVVGKRRSIINNPNAQNESFFQVSSMSQVREESWAICSPNVIAKKSLENLGKKSQISPYWGHRIILR